jgi:hypothetical protein
VLYSIGRCVVTHIILYIRPDESVVLCVYVV